MKNGLDVRLTTDGAYRPNTLMIKGELASRTVFEKKHGYGWKTTASGNILYYATESGKEYEIPQKALMEAK